MVEQNAKESGPAFDAASTGALSHLFRAEVYRSTVWRSRLDTTTNWAVVTTGLALSLAYSSPAASPLPLALVGLLVALFLFLEARRYRTFDSWRLRVRILENQFYGPILDGGQDTPATEWRAVLAQEYREPTFHMSMFYALGRRLRRNYSWIFLIQVFAYVGKLLIHPTTLTTVDDLWQRATIGPIHGSLVLAAGVVFHLSWALIVVFTWNSRRGRVQSWPPNKGPDPTLRWAGKG